MTLDLKDALRIAAKDPEFAQAFMKNPGIFKTAFNLTDEQITGIKNASESFVEVLGVEPDGYE